MVFKRKKIHFNVFHPNVFTHTDIYVYMKRCIAIRFRYFRSNHQRHCIEENVLIA